MNNPPSRGPTVAVLGAGPCAIALTHHLQASGLRTLPRYVRPSARDLPPLEHHPVVCVLYPKAEVWDALWPRIVPALTPGTHLIQLGPHRMEDARRLVEYAWPHNTILHAPLSWNTRRSQLYGHVRTRDVLRLAKRRWPYDSVHRRTLDALTALPLASPLTVPRPRSVRAETNRSF